MRALTRLSSLLPPSSSCALQTTLHSQLSNAHTHRWSSSSGKDPLEEVVESPHARSASINFGVFRESETEDVTFLVEHFTAPALARALRVREQTLQLAAHLASTGSTPELTGVLKPFLKSNVDRRRSNTRKAIVIDGAFSRRELIFIQRTLQNMPREVFQAADRRASVVIPICNVNGIASILFERRSTHVRTHKQQVCFPGGMVDEAVDATIVQTSLREMEEEIGIPPDRAEVLGILRCNWEEVTTYTGIAVTPVVCFIGDLKDLNLRPNPAEVEELFTVAISDLLEDKSWLIREFSAPVFTGAPFVIWGLTAFLLQKFLKDVILKMSISSRTSLI